MILRSVSFAPTFIITSEKVASVISPAFVPVANEVKDRVKSETTASAEANRI